MGRIRPDHHPKVQHYVPKMLLRNFKIGKKKNPKIYVFDKHKGDVGQAFKHATAIRNIAAESGFYDFEVGEQFVSIETLLSEIENRTAATFAKLLNEKNLAMLSEGDKAWISIFVACQHVRGRSFRETTKRIDEALSQRIRDMGGDVGNVKGWSPFEDQNDIKAFASTFLVKSSKQFSAAIASKAWILLETSPDTPFWIGDNPVAMHNDRDFGPYGNIGLRVTDIQIYLPLSPTLTLAMWCTEMVQNILVEIEAAKNAIESARMLKVMARNVNQDTADATLKEAEAKLEYSEQLKRGIESGIPVPCVPENVTFMNSLQVEWAYRFIMSNKRDFSLAERMIREHPDLRKGRAIQVN